MLEENLPLHILFVDDEDTIRQNYVLVLEQMFTTVSQASNGEEAYALYQKYQPDIVIVDISLPKMNGLELLHKIKIHSAKTKAIVMSAHTDSDEQLQKYDLDGIIWLNKPVSRRVFLKTVSELAKSVSSK